LLRQSSDVNVDRRRFSVDFAVGALVSGDQIEIRTLDGSNLILVDGHVYPDWKGYAYVDPMGGIRLYKTYGDALRGNPATALALTAPTAAKDIRIRTLSGTFRALARIREYELTTTRETVDTTVLGQEFRNQYEAGLITGQGRMTCLWDDGNSTLCASDQCPIESTEFPMYLAQLVIRLRQGAGFRGRYYLHRGTTADEKSVWYECDCVVTSVAVTVPSTGVIDAQIEFVTTSTIMLNHGYPTEYLLQEAGAGYLLQEDDSKIQLETPA